jgi:DNA-binding LacI/PurR family transcriptional regulator
MTTLAEVAARAGVGIGTVSRVVNDHPNVSARMRVRVEAAMEDVGYTRPRRSRDKSSDTGEIGVLVPFFDEPSAYLRLRGIVARLQPHGLNIVLYNIASPAQSRDHIDHLLRAEHLVAIIVISLPLADADARQFALRRSPTVLLDTASPHLPSVGIDDRAGGSMATNHLLQLVTGASPSSASRRRTCSASSPAPAARRATPVRCARRGSPLIRAWCATVRTCDRRRGTWRSSCSPSTNRRRRSWQRPTCSASG